MASHLSEKIKYQIVLRGMSITEFATKYNIVRAHIDNIIYDRSRNPEIITQIAKALEIPVDYLLYEKDVKATEFSNERKMDKFKNFKKFDIVLFRETVNIITEIYLEQNIEVTHKKFYDNLEEIYYYALRNNYDNFQLKSFAQILVNYSMKYNRTKKKLILTS